MNDTRETPKSNTNDDGILYEAPHETLPDISDTGGASAILFNSYWFRLYVKQHDYLHTNERQEWEVY